MNLYLHIGTEKTGSSHLQSLSAINRDLLKKSGIWFPEAEKRDNMLLSGDISAGNAHLSNICLVSICTYSNTHIFS